MEVGWLPWNYFEPESLFLKMFGAIRWWLLESNKINPLEGTCKNCSLVRRQRAVSHRHVSKRRVFHKLITQQRRILKVKEGTEFSRIMWWENRKHCNYTSVLHISKTIEMERMLQVFLLELLISQIFEQQKKNVSVAVITSIKCQVYERSGVKYYILEENWGCQQKNENKFWSGYISCQT